ncbi:MAG TPA: hypothetical protein VK721_05060 [Solirubrobacteraceae bacterium]|jgi:hypothetical protein|nr:hypothetical protein [Solirubrobacteraceae bacterium]
MPEVSVPDSDRGPMRVFLLRFDEPQRNAAAAATLGALAQFSIDPTSDIGLSATSAKRFALTSVGSTI